MLSIHGATVVLNHEEIKKRSGKNNKNETFYI